MAKQVASTALDIGPLIDALLEGVRNIVHEELATMKKAEGETLISSAEACKIFRPAVSRPTLARWTSEGYLKSYRIASRVWYKESEIIQAAKHLKPYKTNYALNRQTEFCLGEAIDQKSGQTSS